MLTSLLLSLIITAPASANITSFNQNSNAIVTSYADNNEIKFDFKLSESAAVDTYGSPGSRSSESGTKSVLLWKKYANNRSQFMEKYPTVKLKLYSKLGEEGVLHPKKVDKFLEFETAELFGGIPHTEYISGYSYSYGSYKVAGDTYVIGSSDDDFAYIKIGCYVEGGWDAKDRQAKAMIKLHSVVFVPKK